MTGRFAGSDFAHFDADWHFARAFDAGELVFLSGVTGCRPDYTVAEEPEAQFRDAFEILGATLAEAGLDFGCIVEMTSYHVELRRHLDAFVKVKDAFVKPPYPAWSCIGTPELITPGTLVEIRVVCRRPQRS
jgi:enamine deaminase RidA (YjgF/YER057c/UK114 family)